MGSLTSKPKPTTPVYVSTPVASTSAPVATATETTTDTSSSDGARAAALVRSRTLPETILTSFRGVLSQNDFVPHRKSLLGE